MFERPSRVDRIGSTAVPANLGAGNNETRLVAFIAIMSGTGMAAKAA